MFGVRGAVAREGQGQGLGGGRGDRAVRRVGSAARGPPEGRQEGDRGVRGPMGGFVAAASQGAIRGRGCHESSSSYKPPSSRLRCARAAERD
jgi:hypothetical protein